ncbi:hypothetical protein [Halarchaeum nitratireducens]|uniref:Uncharacterized protein n=1 Tax=Halarchaeum nitratireducens TaxID=489913 RepID=A0A830G707_9EURY|nr:hypothetical protein [Halarchaeum nitratireducens]GGN08044.1 hypothetical protein GCM10009021_04180 [Halarchaeum nitratireducens]
MSSEEDVSFGEPEFLAYRLLVRLKEQSKGQITRSKYLKLCCIADRYLEQNDVDIEFPRYWYKYGEIASESDIDGRVAWSTSAKGFPGRQYFPSDRFDAADWEDQYQFDEELYAPADDIETDDFDVDEETRRKIDEAIRWVVHRLGKKSVSEIRHYQYQRYAPLEFIRAYSDLRWQLENTEPVQGRLTMSATQQSSQELVEELLDEMVMAYPEEKFNDMYSLFLRWEDTVRLLLENQTNYEEVEEFFDSFIEALSKVELRFAYREDIPDERLSGWEEEREEVKTEFREELREVRDGHLFDRGTSGTFEALSEPFSKTVMDDIEESLEDQM